MNLLYCSVSEKVNIFFPLKNIKFSSDDSPWCSERIKKLKRLKGREYNKHRSSKKWSDLKDQYKLALIKAKHTYYSNIVKDLKLSNPSQWYSKLKRICSYDQEKFDPLVCNEIELLSKEEQVEKIADHFCAVRQKFTALKTSAIEIPSFDKNTIPQFSELEVEKKLKEINPRKSVPEGDIPPNIIKQFAEQFKVPLTDIINSSIKQGIWPAKWKQEYVTPVPKVFPTKLLKNLRSISGLMTFNKIQEKLISEIIISDMKESMDPSQYGNEYGLSIQHYLINMIDKILSDSDAKGVTAVLATFVDWKDAFPNQCPELGIKSFIECGVRPSLIPVLISYFQERSVIVKWNGVKSKPKNVPGGGPQGAYLGNLEYKAQSNKSANCVEKDSRFKFVDDLTTLEKINLLLVGMASHNTKQQVPNDIHMSNHIIPPEHLKSQNYLNEIQKWTNKQQMVLNEEKTKNMIFNFSKNKKFSTRLQVNNKHIETVKEIKLLGTIITDDLKWGKNTKFLVKRAYGRMELLRQMANFTKSTKDKMHIYKMYIRSVVEQSCVVWHHNISKLNESELERVQKVAV